MRIRKSVHFEEKVVSASSVVSASPVIGASPVAPADVHMSPVTTNVEPDRLLQPTVATGQTPATESSVDDNDTLMKYLQPVSKSSK